MADKKLHELLAVEGQLKGQAEKTRTGLTATFSNKRHLFEEKVTVFTPVAEGGTPKREQQSDIETTVPVELAWIADIWAKALDVSVQVQDACTTARADVVLDDGTVLMTAVPVLALLELEKRVGEMKGLAEAIPTLDPAKGFRPDAGRGAGYYMAREVSKNRTAKEQRPLVLYPATPEHPAQTQLITQDVVTGTITEQEWSGLITPAQKAEIITRAEELHRAVKQARVRAAQVAVPKAWADGSKLLRYVFFGTATPPAPPKR